MFNYIPASDWLRIVLLYGHLVFCAFAITAILKTDIAVVLGKISREGLRSTATAISSILAALWVTGLSVIYLDTGFSVEILLGKPKLLLKLMCVFVLTVNGMVLHHISFPILTRNSSPISLYESLLLAVTGAISTSHWMLAAFIGMSKPLGMLPLKTLFMAYFIFISAVFLTSLCFIPLLNRAVAMTQRPALNPKQAVG